MSVIGPFVFHVNAECGRWGRVEAWAEGSAAAAQVLIRNGASKSYEAAPSFRVLPVSIGRPGEGQTVE